MNSKIIHYCWFGGKSLTPLARECLASWEKYMPDYEIKRWDETNFNPSSIPFTEGAYKAGKWAFVSDYVRFKAIYEHGGLYLDTDVEIIKNLEPLGDNFFGIEHYRLVAPGLGFRSDPGNIIFKELMNTYESLEYKDKYFLNPTSPDILTRTLFNHGLRLDNLDINYKVDDYAIYSLEYLCPLNHKTKELNITNNTYAIHHYAGSWLK